MDGREIPSLEVTMESLGVREVKLLPIDPFYAKEPKEVKDSLNLASSPPKESRDREKGYSREKSDKEQSLTPKESIKDSDKRKSAKDSPNAKK
jgi:hypothetical protein